MTYRILIADDLDYIREALEFLLEEAGHRVVSVRDGQELLDELDANPDYHIVFSDQNMPELTGLEAFRSIRADPRFTNLPLIMVSAPWDDGSSEREITGQLGGLFIHKPFSTEAILTAIETALRN